MTITQDVLQQIKDYIATLSSPVAIFVDDNPGEGDVLNATYATVTFLTHTDRVRLWCSYYPTLEACLADIEVHLNLITNQNTIMEDNTLPVTPVEETTPAAISETDVPSVQPEVEPIVETPSDSQAPVEATPVEASESEEVEPTYFYVRH